MLRTKLYFLIFLNFLLLVACDQPLAQPDTHDGALDAPRTHRGDQEISLELDRALPDLSSLKDQGVDDQGVDNQGVDNQGVDDQRVVDAQVDMLAPDALIPDMDSQIEDPPLECNPTSLGPVLRFGLRFDPDSGNCALEVIPGESANDEIYEPFAFVFWKLRRDGAAGGPRQWNVWAGPNWNLESAQNADHSAVTGPASIYARYDRDPGPIELQVRHRSGSPLVTATLRVYNPDSFAEGRTVDLLSVRAEIPCPDGFEERDGNCVNRDECADGGAICSPQALCEDTEGGYRCTCPEGERQHDFLGSGTLCAPDEHSKMIEIPAGVFQMGVPEGSWPWGSSGSGPDQPSPPVEITLTRSFLMDRTEVTRAEWLELMGELPLDLPDCEGACPISQISVHSAMAFANARSEAEGLPPCYSIIGCTGSASAGQLRCNSWDDSDVQILSPDGSVYGCQGYRLPTRAEWRYSARAGTSWQTYAGPFDSAECEGNPRQEAIAWFCGNSGRQPHPVGERFPNPWGLVDMLGNLWEFSHGPGDLVNPVDPVESQLNSLFDFKALGGGYTSRSNSTYVSAETRANAMASIGFRLVRTQVE